VDKIKEEEKQLIQVSCTKGVGVKILYQHQKSKGVVL